MVSTIEAVPSAIREMVERLASEFDPLRILLFGSYARGEATPDSDVDLLVVMPNGCEKRAIAVEMRRRLKNCQIPKDIIVTTPEEIERRGDLVGTVLRPALREGTVVYERT